MHPFGEIALIKLQRRYIDANPECIKTKPPPILTMAGDLVHNPLAKLNNLARTFRDGYKVLAATPSLA